MFNNATTYTTPFQKWDGWHHKNQVAPSCDWQTPSELAPDKLVQHEKMAKLLTFAQKVFDRPLFTKTRYPEKLVTLRKLIKCIASDETFEKYDTTTLPIHDEVRALAAEVDALYQKEPPEDVINTLLQRTEKTEQAVTSLRKDLVRANDECAKSPIANDARLQEATLRELDKNFQDTIHAHSIYEATLAVWKKDGAIVEGVTQEECWKFAGHTSAVKHLTANTTYIDNALRVVASVLSASLDTHEAQANLVGNLFDRDLYVNKKRGIPKLDVLRDEYVRIACDAQLMELEKNTLPIYRSIRTLTEEVLTSLIEKDGETCNPTNFTPRVAKLAQDITELHNRIMDERQDLEKSPIAKDPRSHKMFYLSNSHVRGEAGKLFGDDTPMGCWNWKGQVKAMKVLERQILYAGHALHVTASAINFLQQNADDKLYLKIPELPEQDIRGPDSGAKRLRSLEKEPDNSSTPKLTSLQALVKRLDNL